MSKFTVWGAVVLLGCGGRLGPGPTPLTCPLVTQVDGFQPVVEGLETTSVLTGPSSSCRAATVELEIVAPDGTKVPANAVELIDTERNGLNFTTVGVRAASVKFTPTQPGVWSLRARWSSGGESVRSVLAIALESGGPSVLRRFVDRMDNCERGPFRTSTGLMICERQQQLWVYGPTGELIDHFYGTQLVVRGDEVWSWAVAALGPALEHRTALESGLRFDGSVPLKQTSPEGETIRGLAIRGEGDRVIAVRWDGTALTSTTLAEGYRFNDPVVITQGNETWTPEFCLVQRGCTVAMCEPVRTCPSVTAGSVIATEPERIWSSLGFFFSTNIAQARLNVSQRPLAVGRGPSSFIDLLFENGASPRTIGGTLGDRLGIAISGFVLVPYQKSPDTIDFVALTDPGTARTFTSEWLISTTQDPFTLLSTPIPSIP